MVEVAFFVSVAVVVYVVVMLGAYALLDKFDPVDLYDDTNKTWAAMWPLWIIAVPIAFAIVAIEYAMDSIHERNNQKRKDKGDDTCGIY